MKQIAKGRHIVPISAQKGFSLITTLILLMIVMLLGVAASQLVLQSERTARYDRDYQIAYQGAEAALKDAEIDIFGPNTASNQRLRDFSTDMLNAENPWPVLEGEGCGTGSDRGKCARASEGQKSIWYTVDFTNTDEATRQVAQLGDFTGRTYASGQDFSGVDSGIRPALKPRYIIERFPDKSPGTTGHVMLYRVTAVGFGPRQETQAVLQMIFRKD